jgi:hypothetical protein
MLEIWTELNGVVQVGDLERDREKEHHGELGRVSLSVAVRVGLSHHHHHLLSRCLSLSPVVLVLHSWE